MEIKDVLGLKQHLRRCSQLKIHRKKYGYNHHVFIGNVDHFGFDIYHYKFVLKPWWKLYSPVQVTKARLNYSSYSDDKEIKKIFNFENGDTAILVNRNDYPQNKDAEEKCIRRAESRVGARNYSVAFNNCESYVNWVFSGDNTSWEYENAPLLKQMFANVVDVMASSVVFKLSDFILRLWNSSRSSLQQGSQKQNNIGHTFKKEERETSKQNGSHLEMIVQKENNSQPELTILERRQGQVDKSCMDMSSIRHMAKKEKDASIPYYVTCNKSSFTALNRKDLETSYGASVLELTGIMAHSGTRFSDCDIFRNSKQNTEQCSLSACGCSVVTIEDVTTEEIFESFSRSVLPELPANKLVGMELFFKSYVNIDNRFMTHVQVDKRVFRDVFSATGGVYGCVYGSHLATTMFPDSVNIAANIGCISGSFLGNAAGAIGSAALLR